ncbi:MAG: hypothetical protein GC191_10150 [Azospirillum sp.]|nr:hypothetical protein [Azospirillum sp.]
MATSLEDLNAYRDGLLKAIGTGSLSVTAGGIARTFRSISELRAALATIDREIASVNSARVRVIRVSSSKGL